MTLYTTAEITYDGEPMLVRARVRTKDREPGIVGPIESWEDDRWVEVGDDPNLLYEAECALIDAHDPRAEAAYGDWRIP